MTAAHDHDHDMEITVTDARGQLGKLLDTHVIDGGVVYLMRNGRRIGAVVAADVPGKLEALEDDYWSKRAADVLAKGEPTVPWDQALALLESGNTDQ